MRWVVLGLGLSVPGVMAFLDAFNREPDEFAGGADDRRAWVRWLAIAAPLCLVGIGYGIVLGYYYGVIRRRPA